MDLVAAGRHPLVGINGERVDSFVNCKYQRLVSSFSIRVGRAATTKLLSWLELGQVPKNMRELSIIYTQSPGCSFAVKRTLKRGLVFIFTRHVLTDGAA